jgi:hypothetical protein
MLAHRSIARLTPIGVVLVPALWLAVGCSDNGGEEGEKQEQAAEEPTQETTDEATPQEEEIEELAAFRRYRQSGCT